MADSLRLQVTTFNGDKLGTISLENGNLVGSIPPLQEMADDKIRVYGSAQAAYDSLKGFNNGYLTIFEDSTLGGQLRDAAQSATGS